MASEQMDIMNEIREYAEERGVEFVADYAQ